jgi:hypothetical protein
VDSQPGCFGMRDDDVFIWDEEPEEESPEPGGCDEHPNAGHFVGYGLAGGGIGVYYVCAKCSKVFNKVQDAG